MRALAYVLVLAACGDDGMATPDAPSDTGGDMGVDETGVPADCVPDRVTVDRPDDNGYDQIRVMYVVPADGADAGYDTNGKICNSIRGIAAWFYEQTGTYLRLDTAGGLLDIGFFRLAKTDEQMRGTDPNNNTIENGTAFVRERIELELEAQGLIAENKLYAVYYDGTSSWACGGGAYPPLIVDRVGAMYLRGMPIGQTVPCGMARPWGQSTLVPSYVDYGMLHEVVHSMGIVAMTSPHQHSTGHVFDIGQSSPNRDLMYSPRAGMNDPGWATDTGLVIDLGSDDYYNAGAADLAKMSVISPLPEGARRPNGW